MDSKCETARHEAWHTTNNVHDRIVKLNEIASECHENMTILSDIASSYASVGNIDKAKMMYKEIIDKKDLFKPMWSNVLGIAYLFTCDYDNAISTLEKSTAICWDQGLFLAFSHLKNGDEKNFKQSFNMWIHEDIRRAFGRSQYTRDMEILFTDIEIKLINDIWDDFYAEYSEMDKYKLYCKLYKQCYLECELDDDEIDDDDFEIPQKLSRTKFEILSEEYNYLDRYLMFVGIDDEKSERHSELRDLLFADTLF